MDFKKAKAMPLLGMTGENNEETELFWQAADEVCDYLMSLDWCVGITDVYFCFGIGGVIVIFLVRANRLVRDGGEAKEWLWVVTGDLPLAYVTTDGISTPHDALLAYCELMMDWVAAVRSNDDLETVYPVDVEPTEGHASMLEARIEFLLKTVAPMIT